MRDISAVLSIAAVVISSGALFWAAREVTEAVAISRIASAINKAVAELRYLLVDTILHHEPRARDQWQTKHAALSALLAGQPLRPTQQDLVDRIARNHAGLASPYKQLTEYHQMLVTGALERSQYRELEDRAVSRLLGHSQEMVSDTLRLAETSRANVLATLRTLSLFIIASFTVIGAVVALKWILITRTILTPIARLQSGIAIIAAGDLSHRTAISGRDEIGALSLAFDDMTTKIRQSRESMAAANAELEAFAYSVSHDLRAPLRSIDGFSKVLLDDYAERLDDEGRDSLTRIRAASQRMGRLIDDMLALSRVTRREISRTRVNLSQMATGIVADLRQAHPERQVELIIEDGVTATTDARLIHMALVNLLDNAWKFTGKRAQARIEFGTTGHDDSRAMFIRDNGAGFDMAYASKLFGAFQRMHGAREFEGTGIGLATVQRIVHRLGGRAWAESAPDQGATFYFTLATTEAP